MATAAITIATYWPPLFRGSGCRCSRAAAGLRQDRQPPEFASHTREVPRTAAERYAAAPRVPAQPRWFWKYWRWPWAMRAVRACVQLPGRYDTITLHYSFGAGALLAPALSLLA
jgi:hypothetical protein